MKISFEDPIDATELSVDDNCLNEDEIHVRIQGEDVEALFVFKNPYEIRDFIDAMQTMKVRLENHLNKTR